MDTILIPLINVLILGLEIYKWCVIVSAIMSWLIAFNVINTGNQLVYTVVDFLYRITEPAIRPIRKFIPNLGGIDISPIILLLAIFFVQGFLSELGDKL